MDFVGAAVPLTEDDTNAAAKSLGCRPAVIHAVCQVEAAGAGFLPDKRPKILFEAHLFHQLTVGRYDDQYPNISSPRWDRSLYGAGGAHQYDRLAVALGLDRSAALRSCSWGMFQVLGVNYNVVGFDSVDAMVEAMTESERRHLEAFATFVRRGGHARDLADPTNYPRFAAFYNGPGQVWRYAGALSQADRQWTLKLSRADQPTEWHAPTVVSRELRQGDYGADVADLQRKLNMVIVPSLRVDGDFGPGTDDAVRAFQTTEGLPVTGVVDQAMVNLLK